MDAARTKSILADLSTRPKCQDWSAKVQYVSKSVWSNIDAFVADDAQIIDDLIALLQDRDAFSVAQHVIPAFRKCSAEEDNNANKTRVLHNLHLKYHQTELISDPLRSDATAALYRAEKQAYYDADMLRARLFLRREEDFSEAEKVALQKWLEDCPIKPGPGG
jgi:hypothetical protein